MKPDQVGQWVRTGLVVAGALAVVRVLGRFGQDGTPDYVQLAQGATLTPAEVAAVVQRLRAAFYGDLFTEDEAAAIAAILEARNDPDVFAIAQGFGTWAPILQTDRDLFAAVRAFLDAPDIEYLNGALRGKGINVQF